MSYLLYPLAIYALILALRYIINFLQIRKTVLQYPKYQLKKGDSVPAYLKKLFATAIQELEQFGFKPCSYLQIEPTIKVYPPINWEILLYNQACKTYATVGIRRPIEPVYLFDIEFCSVFQDKSLLLTMNGKAYGLVGENPNLIVQDVYTAKTSVQWQAHQDKINELSATKTSCGLPPESFTKMFKIVFQDLINCTVKAGKIWKLLIFRVSFVGWVEVRNPTHLLGSLGLAQPTKKWRGYCLKNRAFEYV